MIDIRELQGLKPEQNVLKLFTSAVDPTRKRVYVAAILSRYIAILNSETEQWVGTVDSGIEGSAYRYIYLDPVANYLYVIDGSNHQLRRIDLDTNEAAGPVSIPNQVGAVVVDSKRTQLYLATPEIPMLRIFDGETLS
jgi:DNA-binding beta-propeller fold protein YncE